MELKLSNYAPKEVFPNNFKNQVKNTFTQMKIRQIFLHTREQFQGTTPLVQTKIRRSKSSFPPPNENSTKQIHTSFPLKGIIHN